MRWKNEHRTQCETTADGRTLPTALPSRLKATFHDTDIDTDTDLPDTPTSLRPTCAISSRGIARVGVGVVECGLKRSVKHCCNRITRRNDHLGECDVRGVRLT